MSDRQLARAVWLRLGGPWLVRGPSARAERWAEAAAAFGARAEPGDASAHLALVGRWSARTVAAALDGGLPPRAVIAVGALEAVVRAAVRPAAVLRGRRPLVVYVAGDVAAACWHVGRRPAHGPVLVAVDG